MNVPIISTVEDALCTDTHDVSAHSIIGAIRLGRCETNTYAGRDTFKHIGKVSRKGEPLGLYGNRKQPWERAAKQAEELIRQLNERAKSA